MNIILPSLMTIAGIIIGATMQFYFMKKRTLEAKNIDQKIEAR